MSYMLFILIWCLCFNTNGRISHPTSLLIFIILDHICNLLFFFKFVKLVEFTLTFWLLAVQVVKSRFLSCFSQADLTDIIGHLLLGELKDVIICHLNKFIYFNISIIYISYIIMINFGIILVVIHCPYFNSKILTIMLAYIFGGYYSSTYLPKILIKAHIWFLSLGVNIISKVSLPIIILVVFCIFLGVCVCECLFIHTQPYFCLLGLFILGSILNYLFIQVLIMPAFYNHFWFFVFGDRVEWEVMHGVLFLCRPKSIHTHIWEGLVESGILIELY